ncbi:MULTISPECIES: hypothetical protein [unclassified Pedobacter]|uniref:hypothetical protein n=1 Tax=unclassified Pedobacter TaxID=2628915 RepID=UPI001E44A4BF|nr:MULTISPECIES: hypothetical protein [unclassified Pedobacter]
MMNKLMLSKGKAMACLILMCLFVAQSCKKDLLKPESNDLHNGISIAEAKAYFDSNLRQNAKPKKLMSNGPLSNSVNLHDLLNSKQPIWDKAYEKLISTGKAVKIPLDFGKAEIIVNSKTKSVIPFSSLNYLLMYKDSLEQIHAEWVSLVPQASWLEKQSNAYRGQVFVKDWAGKLIKCYSYNTVQPQPKTALGAKGKIMSATETHLTLPVYAESYCIRLPAGVCTCTAPPCDWRSCNVCGKTICGLVWSGGGGDEPDQEPENNNSQNYDGWTPTSHSGGGGVTNWTDYLPSCNPDPNYTVPNYPAPNGQEWVMSCYGLPLPESPIFEAREYMANYMGITDLNKQNFLLSNSNVYGALVDYTLANGDTPENKDFINWAVGYLMQNPSVNLNDFTNQFFPTTTIITNPDADSWTDPDDQILFDSDQTVYQQYQDNQPWPTVNRVIEFEKFVPLRQTIGPNGQPKDVSCLILAKEQLGKAGYTCSGYLPGSQTFSIYTTQNGVDLAETKKAISYVISSLNQKIPVLIGVDNRPGPPAANLDNSTDHYVVIVGMGTDINGKYFQFVDSATNNPSTGASYNNRLYYNSATGKITGKTAIVGYRNLAGMHDYIITQVRKSIKK